MSSTVFSLTILLLISIFLNVYNFVNNTLNMEHRANTKLTSQPDDLLRLYVSYQMLHNLYSCQRLKIFDNIPEKHNYTSPISLQTIASKCNISNENHLRRVLRFVSMYGYTTKIENTEYYIHTNLSLQYARNPVTKLPYNPFSYYSLASTAHPIELLPYFSLYEWILNGKTPFEHYFGVKLYDLNTDAMDDYKHYFSLYLKHYGNSSTTNFAHHFISRQCNTMTIYDIGGGLGQMCALILNDTGLHLAHDLTCNIFDTPKVIKHAKNQSINVFGEDNIDKNKVNYISGNFFDFTSLSKLNQLNALNALNSSKMYLLKHVLHNYNDNDCIKIIENIAKLIHSSSSNEQSKTTAKLVIVEILLKEENEKYDKANTEDLSLIHFDVSMAVLLNGKERTLSQYDFIMQHANFTRTSIKNDAMYSLIEYELLQSDN
eukprot:116208_1